MQWLEFRQNLSRKSLLKELCCQNADDNLQMFDKLVKIN